MQKNTFYTFNGEMSEVDFDRTRLFYGLTVKKYGKHYGVRRVTGEKY